MYTVTNLTADGKKEKRNSTRQFIAAAAIPADVAGAALVAAKLPAVQAGAQGSAVPAVTAGTASSLPASWDYEADVVVIGYGGAGVCAAIAAHDAGSSVLVLEKAPTPDGGNTGVSGGHCWICLPLTDFITYVKMMCWDTVTDDELITATCKAITDLPNWIQSLGGKMVFAHYSSGVPKTLPVDFVSPDFTLPQFSIQKPDGTAGAGVDFFAFLSSCAASRGIPVMYSTPAKELIQNPYTKEILGVRATDNTGKDIYIKAAKGVVLASGGYQNNPEMRTNFLSEAPHSAFMTFSGTPYNTGDGIVMAQLVGAKLWHMNKKEVNEFASKAASQEIGNGIVLNPAYGMRKATTLPAIIVNRYGQRFMNEYFFSGHNDGTKPWTYFDEEFSVTDSRDFCDYPNIPFYMIFDATMMKAGPLVSASNYAGRHKLYVWSQDNSVELAKGWIISANTIKELGGKITCKDYFGRVVGMDVTGLNTTISNYNNYCAAGKDPDFSRNPKTLKPITTAPFYAIELCECLTNTDGGPVHNKYSQTIDANGKPIPRLYSPGELGSIWGFLYSGAGNLPEALAMGRVAGQQAAKLLRWI